MKQSHAIPAVPDARLLLQQELSRRCEKNPRYSLRSFAKSLGMSHTVLSLVLSGKRPLSKKAIRLVADHLCLNPAQTEQLLARRGAQPQRGSTSGREMRSPGASSASADYQQITLDTFALISDWIHYAILSLLEIDGSRFDARWIAKHLGITEITAKLAMERLVRLDLVAKNKFGRWRQTGKPLKVENTVSTASTRKFHQQLMYKAIESLENDPMEVRDFSAITLAMDSQSIPYAKERIRQFRRELSLELERMGVPKRVYNLTVQIYPVSKKMEEK